MSLFRLFEPGIDKLISDANTGEHKEENKVIEINKEIVFFNIFSYLDPP